MSDLDLVAVDGVLRAVRPHRGPSAVCEQHPDLDWPHGDCAGPGCPPEYRTRVLAELLNDLRLAAAFGDAAAASWLGRRGIAERPWKGDA